jgi:hypothetical protein
MHIIARPAPPLRVLAALCAFALAFPTFAVETKFWRQDDFSDLEKGNLDKISIRSDGRLSLAPSLHEVLDSSTPYLWAVAQDGKGNLYAGGGGPEGSTAQLFRVNAAGKSTVVAELPGLEIHAIAIDRNGAVYAATDPDGKVYRIAGGKPEVFFDPKEKYIWALAFSPSGDLYVATGDQGDIYKVTPDGKGSIFFQTEEAHARSMAVDRSGNLIVGTEPGGIIIRISPAGEGFILYQAPKREITAVAVAADGSIYAAGVGNKGAAPFRPPAPQPAPAPATPSPATSAPGTPAPPGTQRPAAPTAPPPPTVSGAATSIVGGSDVYRIYPDGSSRKIWSHAQDVAYAIAFDRNGKPLVGTGNKGNIYRLDSDLRYTLLLNLAPTQVTGFAAAANGGVFAATGNVGKVYRIGPELARQGTFESDTFDGGGFTYWGALNYSGSASGGGVSFETRSGNVSHPQKYWSPWTKVPLEGRSGRVAAPPSRFLQYRVTLTAAADGRSPELVAVEVAYLGKNVAPMVQAIDIPPANYRFSPSISSPLGAPTRNITLQPMNARKPPAKAPLAEIENLTMQHASGYQGVRWMAQDENEDTLTYKLEIRGSGENHWTLLKDDIREKNFSFDATAFADGKYVVRVTASDAPSNPPDQALSASLESDAFLIDNTPPEISGLAAIPSSNGVDVRWTAKDALSIITKAEYSVNGGDWTLAQPVTKLSDSPQEQYQVVIPRNTPAGECTIAVRVSDEYDNQTVQKIVVK